MVVDRVLSASDGVFAGAKVDLRTNMSNASDANDVENATLPVNSFRR